MKLNNAIIGLACAAVLAGCGPKKVPLAGERLDPRSVVGAGEAGPAPADTAPHKVAIRLPAPRVNAEWTERNGGPTHATVQPALGSSLAPVWAVQIGKGDDKRRSITADPVVAGGRIFTQDAAATVTAVSTAGQVIWSTDITPPGDNKGVASGGGLAYGDGKVFATSAYGEVVALDPATGKILWRQKFDAPVTGAPTVSGKTLYVTARDATGWAIDTANGRVRWTFQGTASVGSLTGGAAPAVSGGMAVFPFSSDELIGALTGGGTVLWSANIAGRRLGKVYAEISDIAGDPVIVGNNVYVGNATGRVGSYDLRSGDQNWVSDEGTLGPVWPVGGSLFFVSDQAHLVRLNAATGQVIWKAEMPYYVPTRKEKRRRDIYVNFGPLLAGNRLIVPSSDGNFRVFDPASGQLVATSPIGGAATTDPVVANRTLYIVTADGKLRAFR